MDGNKYALGWEIFKALYGIAIIVLLGDWFGADKLYAPSSKLLLAYFVFSVLITGLLNRNKDNSLQTATA